LVKEAAEAPEGKGTEHLAEAFGLSYNVVIYPLSRPRWLGSQDPQNAIEAAPLAEATAGSTVILGLNPGVPSAERAMGVAAGSQATGTPMVHVYSPKI
jgi:hypothetical protein